MCNLVFVFFVPLVVVFVSRGKRIGYGVGIVICNLVVLWYWCVVFVGWCFMANGQLARFAPRTYGVAENAAAPTSPDRGK
jgi:threonine/homoserine/homoserine lactone efflux protein